ncbi:hypothetical protein SESBI_44767 [Sesbania bispinosa]|nr:hypothetical protein SESBI_44767 [Sesbania bispinosa]
MNNSSRSLFVVRQRIKPLLEAMTLFEFERFFKTSLDTPEDASSPSNGCNSTRVFYLWNISG